MQMLTSLLMVLAVAAPQRIETQFPDRTKVIRLETAINHLTVIELAEPVLMAAAGSPLFKIERRENKVFIQPLQEGASTNMFVWTSSGRWNYELAPAASVETMHFAIDQQAGPPPQGATPAVPPAGVTTSQTFAEEMFLFAKPIRNLNAATTAGQVSVVVTDVFRKDGQLVIRYVIDNQTKRPYLAGQPAVFKLDSPHSEASLHALRYSQLDSRMDKKIGRQAETRLQLMDCEIPSEPLPPGEMATGILVAPLPMRASGGEPVFVRLLFGADQREPISVMLVL